MFSPNQKQQTQFTKIPRFKILPVQRKRSISLLIVSTPAVFTTIQNIFTRFSPLVSR